MPDALPLVPEITNEDIEWVRDLMGLEPFDEPRRAFLTARDTMDVAACPGSGKTTLVVAKLAILARKWPHRAKGICVLSHTNVAREAIQHRLGSTLIGQRLLGYPHFIDTIHGFVNHFLALPWLNSNGYPSPTIDNDVTTAYRRGTLSAKQYWTVQSYLQKRHTGFDRLRVCARDLSFDIGGKQFPAGPTAASFILAKQAVESSAKAGYFCYDEMFVWARSLLEDCPSVGSWLRRRFPLVLIDEMQDTFEVQCRILHAVFPRTSSDVVVQRVGDPNQAIFDDFDAEPNASDPFPDGAPARTLSIPNSYRFGADIAALASPFAVDQVGKTGLCGIAKGQVTEPSLACAHAIFIFPDNTTSAVLDAYGQHLLMTFDDNTLSKGAITAVGAVHYDASDVVPGHAHFPKSVQNYWTGYAADIARKEPHPKYLVHYVRAAQGAARDSLDLAPAVERLASGVMRLAGCFGNASHIKRKVGTHRTILAALEANAAATEIYRRLIKTLLLDWMPLNETNWDGVQADILAVASALCEGDTVFTNAKGFLAWPGDDKSLDISGPRARADAGINVYRVAKDGRCVDIRLGSIHSVKGQTHLATLVLDTYWHQPYFQRLAPWLLGGATNGNSAGKQDRKRLLQNYVAMTRPSHLVCLAARWSTFGDAESLDRSVIALCNRGWRVALIDPEGKIDWHQG